MSVAPIQTHVADALGRLFGQFQGRPIFAAVLTQMAGAVQQLENAANTVAPGCAFTAAQGAQLDGIGSVVGEPRNGQSDAIYRLFLTAKIAANASKATHGELISLAQALFEAQSVSLRGSFPQGGAPYEAPMAVGAELGAPALPTQYFATAIGLLRQAFAAGVTLSYVTQHAQADAFALAGATPGLGLASDDGSVTGGQLAADLYTSSET